MWERAVDSGATPAGLGAWEIARVEAGRVEWGIDIDDSTIPQEANFDELDAISYTKGCYIGQEVVARVHFRGHVNRHLRGLRAASTDAPPTGRAAHRRFWKPRRRRAELGRVAAARRHRDRDGAPRGGAGREPEREVGEWRASRRRDDAALPRVGADRARHRRDGAGRLAHRRAVVAGWMDGARARRGRRRRGWNRSASRRATATCSTRTASRARPRGCDVIFHTAAAITPSGGWEAFRRLNVDGTRNAIAAAERSGARLLHLSSVAVYGPKAVPPTGQKDGRGRAARPAPRRRVLRALEARVRSSWSSTAHASGTDLGDGRSTGRDLRLSRPTVRSANGADAAPRCRADDRRRTSTLAMVHAANVADGAVRAAMCDIAGGRVYNLANDFDVTVREFFTWGGEGLGRRVRCLSIPKPHGARRVQRAGGRAAARDGGPHERRCRAGRSIFSRATIRSRRSGRAASWVGRRPCGPRREFRRRSAGG